MSRLVAESREELIEQLTALIKSKLKNTQQISLVSQLLSRYYANVDLEDLLSRDLMDLYGAVLSHWSLIFHRKPGEAKVRVYNPHFEQHGWQSTHTIVEVSHDDMPFLIDSLQMEITRLGFTSHLIIHFGGLKVRRSDKHRVTEILPDDTPEGKGVTSEAPIYFEIDKQTDPDVLENLRVNLERVLVDVKLVVSDFHAMKQEIVDAIEETLAVKKGLDPEETKEALDFMSWINNNHFTFIGCRNYELVTLENKEKALKIMSSTGLGVLRNETHSKKYRTFSELPERAQEIATSKQLLVLAKTNTPSSVHRPVYTDYIGIKRFDEQGNLIGERRFIGLYTSAAYNSNPTAIPLLRKKVVAVLHDSGHTAGGHAWKALVNILETLPRDDLFQATSTELLELGMGILQIQERKRIRLFMRQDIYCRFVSCLVYVPRENYDTQLRRKMQHVLEKALNALDVSFSTWFSDSNLARIHFLIRVDPTQPLEYSVKELQKKMIEVGRPWGDELVENLIEYYGEERGTYLANHYCDAFSVAYRETFMPRTAVYDIEHMETLTEDKPLAMSFYQSFEQREGEIHFKIFHPEHTIPLSDVLPVMENMGLRVIGETPYVLNFKEGRQVWINDFNMIYAEELPAGLDKLTRLFQEAFAHVWYGQAENDGFNKLVLAAGLSWRETAVLRAYAKYLRQTGFTFSQAYIEETLAANPVLSAQLVEMFNLRFNPEQDKNVALTMTNLEAKILKGLDSVANLDQDRILRRFLEVIYATLRTNYFQQEKNGFSKPYLSFKLDPNKIPDLPLPLPMFEIFVYSPRFEGVHLRGGKVARGGLRWSDRREDFRTEILGLMKAQQVKNAVIVPSGAKGGFVPKCLPLPGDRDAFIKEGIACYRSFISGLLDITDNLKEGEVIPPENVVCYDGDDPYLVVAADKGTATFSDIANEISVTRDFWMGDAFASGGSTGYDHKKMGITARGAWESVKRHFLELGKEIQSEPFTAVGIGDMAGDVFGNGMLLSEQTKLVAAFNHLHIFIDPDPDPTVSYKERQRLFALPRSGWDDYDNALLSKGAGVFSRAAKSIKLTPEIKSLLDLTQDFIVPNDLIRAILKAPVDLLWNGGIGTFIKATHELHTQAGDRGNDAIRINAKEVRAKVIGEGGNLGLTQSARVEYALNGGAVNTDAIDNSAGVDCSDHEVNIKILLNRVVNSGDMTEKKRNELLAQMTNDVAQLVLEHNYYQALSISMAEAHAAENIDLLRRYIQELEQQGRLNRDLEFLPDDASINDRKATGKGLTRPEFSVLLAYTKNIVKEEILNSDVPEDEFLAVSLMCAFPKALHSQCYEAMQQHSLRREIIATQLSNRMINNMGVTFVQRLYEETGAPISSIVRCYYVIEEIFHIRKIWQTVKELDKKISADTQIKILVSINRLVRRATRWILRNRRRYTSIGSGIDYFIKEVEQLRQALPTLLLGVELEKFTATRDTLLNDGVPEAFAEEIATMRAMFSALDIIDAAKQASIPLESFAKIYFELGAELELGWFRDLITNHPVEDHWEALARAALRDDLDMQQRNICTGILIASQTAHNQGEKITAWLTMHKSLIERWQHMLADLRSTSGVAYTMFAVAVRELMDIAQATAQDLEEGSNGDDKSAETRKIA